MCQNMSQITCSVMSLNNWRQKYYINIYINNNFDIYLLINKN
jgi:hypothetical protein